MHGLRKGYFSLHHFPYGALWLYQTVPGFKVRLREVRENALVTQEELAQRSGVGKASISRIETGHHVPRFSTIKKLAAALDVEPQELIDRKGAGS